ncbi:Fibronectin-binding protein [Bifidobacterium pseudolongum subsp. globosum]|uniref:Spy0128 family protein n=1 Tax=Bifidobacterium pseudolongum TaxID=1694 RepID=UPI0010D9D9E6|nr:FctA domain-containing protein [Bifidobacterium pseudolongum]RYQ05869.1 Fibronectin-binding protein [Bifidobacterium pseudolongum subsp. globosum]RYQ10747.1 Fibronectin-binding protein [Bifidobacterium pseudolongum subsp. globosum]RYQ15080.1 Fibronectin-binding protein [Bifidobacterium pseudolongum subsp. globosum]RYQ17088.1 Fibronectin-binding protein [Bifidobacterium pseudolongum subsp. globosum]
MPGVSYDTHVADVTVTVTDNKQGDLVATATVVGNVFVNEYEAKEFTGVPAGMAFSKELTGISWPEDREFEFTLEGKDESTPMPAETKATVGKPEQGAKADFAFGDITYTQPGVYEYTVKEAKGDMPGVAYDTHTAKVTVKVADNGQGRLEAKATVEGAKFTNSYNAKPFEGVPAGLEFSKQLTGIAWPADRAFEFTLEAATDGAPMPAEAKATVGKPAEGDTASFGFGAIRYEKPGMYEYTVKETRGTMPGVAYDYHTACITVTVTDNGQGQLDATAKVADGKFVNTYSAVPATGVPTDFTLTKRVEGMEWNADQKFEFTIQAQGGAPMPKNATVTVGKPANGDTATFDFGEIVFERAGVYRYTVTETAGSHPGMVYDGHTATITVDVADDGQGHLVTATTVVNGLFTNTYSTQTVAYPGVDVTEDLTGRAQAQGEFQFVVSGSADDMARAGYTTRAVTSTPYEFAAAASGETVTVPGLFTGLELTHSDVCAGKRFVYEVDQTGAQSGNVLTVDDQVYRVEIWATDNGDGTMRVHTSINGVESTDPTPVLPFHNVYATAPVTIGGDAQVRINARKTLHGRALADGEFRFVVRDAKGAQLAGGTNAANGAVNFDAIEFTDARLISDVQAGIATAHVDGTRTVYRYEVTVSELTDALPTGITALESGFAATLVITDNGQGKLEAAVEYPANADGTLGFVNQYGAASEVSLGLNGNKVLAVAGGNNAPDITGKYTFTLSGSQGAPMPQKTTAVNDAAGAVDFGQITYTMANVFGEQEAKPEEPKADENTDGSDDASDVEADDVTTREKTFTYTVTESGSVAGVANDASAQRTITVHVKDNGDGTLTVSKESAASGTDFTFTNTYGVRPTDPTSPTDTSVKGGVPLAKTLSGRDLKAGEFTFELIEAASGKVVGSAANTADGSVSLPGVVFEAPGSYAYLVRELAGTTGGVTYDSRVYAAVATVVDNGDGTLGVSWAVTEPAVGPVEAMVFENTYAAQPTSVQISAGKMLLGRDLAAGEFQFALTALDSAPMPEGATDGVQTVANDEHGNAQFGVIDYAQAGEYHYTVSEVKGDAEGVTYDETEHAVVVRVTDDGEGQLLAAVEYGDGEQGVVFMNTYTKPAEPDTPDTPDTPDQPKPNMPAPSTPAAPQYPASGTPTYRPYSYSTGSRPYTGTVAYTGADVALIVAVAAVLLAAGAALLTMARRRQ